jgi:ATP-dependent Lon protease
LETPSVTERLEKVLGLIDSEISVLQVEKRIRTRVKRQVEKTQREYFLNEQMKAIQNELRDEEGKDELAEIEDKIREPIHRTCGEGTIPYPVQRRPSSENR